MNNEDYNDKGDQTHCHCHMDGPMKKEFKLAMLEKKEKMMEVELEFIRKMKGIIKKMPEGKK